MKEKRLSENLATCSKFKVALKICGADGLLDGVGDGRINNVGHHGVATCVGFDCAWRLIYGYSHKYCSLIGYFFMDVSRLQMLHHSFAKITWR